MKKFFVSLLKRITKSLEEDQKILKRPTEEVITITAAAVTTPPKENLEGGESEHQEISIKRESSKKKPDIKPSKKKTSTALTTILFDPRDVIEIMEVPFLSLSKKRTAPINYESPDGTIKVKVSCHTGHYLASIYDWDIILFLSGKIQEIINTGSDIPPKTFIIPRHELLKALHKHTGKTNRKEIEDSLARLKLTGIETTIRNEDYRYRGGFGFIDSWGYTERKDMKEFRITLSDWVYDGICRKGGLLKVTSQYFGITSALKRFLYRTARKHVGIQNHSWELTLESLYKKSGSEQEFKKFKYDLRRAVKDNDIPGYLLEWVAQKGKTSIRFVNTRKELKQILSQ